MDVGAVVGPRREALEFDHHLAQPTDDQAVRVFFQRDVEVDRNGLILNGNRNGAVGRLRGFRGTRITGPSTRSAWESRREAARHTRWPRADAGHTWAAARRTTAAAARRTLTTPGPRATRVAA